MAQENSPDKGKRQGRTKKTEKPYVEQIDDTDSKKAEPVKNKIGRAHV